MNVDRASLKEKKWTKHLSRAVSWMGSTHRLGMERERMVFFSWPIVPFLHWWNAVSWAKAVASKAAFFHSACLSLGAKGGRSQQIPVVPTFLLSFHLLPPNFPHFSFLLSSYLAFFAPQPFLGICYSKHPNLAHLLSSPISWIQLYI